MGKRASFYARYGDLIVSATMSAPFGPDLMDELRVQVMRGFAEGMAYVGGLEADDEVTFTDPGTVDTTNMPPGD